MTTFLYYYFLVALSGAIYASLFIGEQVISRIKEIDEEHLYSQHSTITRIVFFFMSLIITPMLLRPLLFDNVREEFIEGLVIGSLGKDD